MGNIDAVKKYQAKRDSIMLRPSKEDGKIIRAIAAKSGKSVQAYVLQAIWETPTTSKRHHPTSVLLLSRALFLCLNLDENRHPPAILQPRLLKKMTPYRPLRHKRFKVTC